MNAECIQLRSENGRLRRVLSKSGLTAGSMDGLSASGGHISMAASARSAWQPLPPPGAPPPMGGSGAGRAELEAQLRQAHAANVELKRQAREGRVRADEAQARQRHHEQRTHSATDIHGKQSTQIQQVALENERMGRQVDELTSKLDAARSELARGRHAKEDLEVAQSERDEFAQQIQLMSRNPFINKAAVRAL